MEDERFSHLYKWQHLDTNALAKEDSCFLEFEKKMAELGIRTRVLPNEVGDGYSLWVPLKDFQVAHDLYTGDVRAVIDTPKELYHVFEDDLSFKNKVLYHNKYSGFVKKSRIGNLVLLGAILFILLMLFRFVKFL